jgi:hypothetical protein
MVGDVQIDSRVYVVTSLISRYVGSVSQDKVVCVLSESTCVYVSVRVVYTLF